MHVVLINSITLSIRFEQYILSHHETRISVSNLHVYEMLDVSCDVHMFTYIYVNLDIKHELRTNPHQTIGKENLLAFTVTFTAVTSEALFNHTCKKDACGTAEHFVNL